MIEVRIRIEEEPRAVHLCEWPVTELDSLIPTVKSWGFYDSMLGSFGHPLPITGMFVKNDECAWFELVVESSDD